MRKLKIAGIVLLVFVLALVVAVRWLVPTDRLVALAYQRLEAETGLVASSGSAEVNLFPLGVRLHGLQVKDPQDDPGRVGLQAQAQEVLIRAGLLSILRRQPEIHEVRLIRPDVALRLPERPAEGESAGATGTAALGLLSIEQGNITVRTATGRVVTLSEVNQSASVRVDAGAVAGDVAGAVGTLRILDPARPAPIALADLRYRIGVSGTPQRVQLDARELVLLGVELTGPVTVELSPLARVEGELEVQGPLPRFVADLLALVPPQPRLWDVSAGLVQGTLRLSGPLPASGGDAAQWMGLVSGEGTISDADIDLAGREAVISAGSRWTLENAELVLSEARLTGLGTEATGRIATPLMPPGMLTGSLALDANLAGLREGLARLWPQLPDSLTQGKMSPEAWPGVWGRVRGPAQLQFPLGRSPGPDDDPLTVELRVDGVRILHPSLSDTLRVATGTVEAGRFGGRADALSLRGPGLEGVWTGELRGWPLRPRLTGTARLARLDLDLLRPPADDGQARAWWGLREARAAPAMPAPPPQWTADMKVSALSLRMRGYEVRDAAGTLTLADQVIRLADATGELGGGPLQAQGRVDWTPAGPRWVLNAQLENASAPGVLQPVAPSWAEALDAPLSGTVSLEGDVASDPAAVKASLTGTGALRTGEGRLDLQPILGDGLATALGADADRLARLTLRSLATVLRIEDGRVHIKDLVLNGPTALNADGWIGFDGEVDYRIDVRLPAGYQPRGLALRSLGSLLEDDEGRIRFAVTLQGPAKSPRISLDTGGATRRAADQVQDRAQDRLETEAREQLGGLKEKLGGLLGGKKDPPPPAAETKPDSTKGGG